MAHDQEAILAGVIAKLAADQSAGSLYEAVSGRIYRTVGPPDTTNPMVVVSVADDAVDRYLEAADTLATLNIAVEGGRDVSETTIQAIVKKLLAYDGSALTVSGHVGGSMWVENRGIPLHDNNRFQLVTLWGVAATAA